MIMLGPAPVALMATPGPMRQLEFVIELVGPRTAPAAAVEALLTRDWQGALGGPRVWAMTAADTHWEPVTPGRAGSYDSVALSYPFMDARGTLASASADALVKLAEGFANQIGRRAAPMPVPADVDGIVLGLAEAREALDVGYGLAVSFVRPVPEAELWRAFVALGLTLAPSGEFVWGSGSCLAVSPVEPPEQFALSGVQGGRQIGAVTLGFSVPRSPDPEASLSATLRVAIYLQQRFGGLFVDEDGNAVVPSEVQLGEYVREAAHSLERAGFRPGSAEALALFGYSSTSL
jgi:hypothetical protein